MKTLDVALSGIFTALYAGGVIFLAPISFSVIQVRLIDCLIPLSAIFGLPMVFGVSVGNIVANLYGGLGVIDIVGGTIANLVAALVIFFVSNRNSSPKILILANLLGTLIITFIVGGYLSIIFFVPLEFSIIGLFVGSLIAITGLGTILQFILQKYKLKEQLK